MKSIAARLRKRLGFDLSHDYDDLIREVEALESGRGPFTPDKLRDLARNMRKFECYPGNDPIEFADRLEATADLMERTDEEEMPEDKDFYVQDDPDSEEANINYLRIMADTMPPTPRAVTLAAIREIQRYRERYHDEDWAAVGIEPYTPDGLRSLAQVVDRHLPQSAGADPDFVAERLRSTAAKMDEGVAIGQFVNILKKVNEQEAEKNEAYRQRNVLVRALASIFPSGIRRTLIQDWNPEWHNCCFIDLPTGQVSYHYHDSQRELFADLPPYEAEWDGHDKQTVEARLLGLEIESRSFGQRRKKGTGEYGSTLSVKFRLPE